MSLYKNPALPKVAQSSQSREKNTMEFWIVLGVLVLLAKSARLRDVPEDYHPTTPHGGDLKIFFIAVVLLFFDNQIVPLFFCHVCPQISFSCKLLCQVVVQSSAPRSSNRCVALMGRLTATDAIFKWYQQNICCPN